MSPFLSLPRRALRVQPPTWLRSPHRPGDLIACRRQHLMDGFDLRGVDRHLAFKTESRCPLRRRAQPIHVANDGERTVDRNQAEGAVLISVQS
jgi:hypothetical protein